MLQLIGIMVAIYCAARLIDQISNGVGWASKGFGALALLGVAFCALLIVVVGEAMPVRGLK